MCKRAAHTSHFGENGAVHSQANLSVSLRLRKLTDNIGILRKLESVWGTWLKDVAWGFTVVSFCQADTDLDMLEKREAQLRSRLSQINMWTCLWGVFFIANWCRRVQPTAGGAIPRQVGLGCIKKGAEQARGSRPARVSPPWLLRQSLPAGSSFELLPLLPSMMNYKLQDEINSLSPGLVLASVLSQQSKPK